MKTTRYFTFTLLSFVMLTLVSNSFAQDVLSEPGVRLVYFLPNDRPARPDRIEPLRQLIKDTQVLYADAMARHGYGRKTFRIETDKDGEPIVHRVDGKFNDTYYHQQTIKRVSEELDNQFDTSQHIYFVAIDKSQEGIGKRALGVASGTKCFISASGTYIFDVQLAAHELGHTFGLGHDFRDNDYIMSYGVDSNDLSKCAAHWLDVHGHFNNASAHINRDASIQMLPPKSTPNGIRLRFEVADADGLHLARLYLKVTPTDPAEGFKLAGCHLFDAENSTIEFVTRELIDPIQDTVILGVIDKHGGMSWQTFPINVAPILPSPKYVSIPDPNLAAAIRKALKLGSEARIPERALQSLRTLDAGNSEIKNFAGLEHAVRLSSLDLWGNQIDDIRPLTELKFLESLFISDNNVRDITPLTKMTRLKWLSIGGNPISDFTVLSNLPQLVHLSMGSHDKIISLKEITFLTNLTNLTSLGVTLTQIDDIRPLTNLTNLKNLWLNGNKIKDIRPLANLTKLTLLNLSGNRIRDVSPLIGLQHIEKLFLIGNPIKNRKPLLAMQRRNPAIKIYLKNYREPLPVSLSHFRAELTHAGVVLRWVTESELNNAGFNILRSETKHGEFKVVNTTMIQGAGTTSERHTYTWKDTTAKPNVVYYYRIEDISHAGVRKSLATVRLRGLISAKGKLATQWAAVKTGQ